MGNVVTKVRAKIEFGREMLLLFSCMQKEEVQLNVSGHTHFFFLVQLNVSGHTQEEKRKGDYTNNSCAGQKEVKKKDEEEVKEKRTNAQVTKLWTSKLPICL